MSMREDTPCIDDLLNQIEDLYEAWARSPRSEETSRLLNGLFEIAKEVDPERMRRAFAAGIKSHEL